MLTFPLFDSDNRRSINYNPLSLGTAWRAAPALLSQEIANHRLTETVSRLCFHQLAKEPQLSIAILYNCTVKSSGSISVVWLLHAISWY